MVVLGYEYLVWSPDGCAGTNSHYPNKVVQFSIRHPFNAFLRQAQRKKYSYVEDQEDP